MPENYFLWENCMTIVHKQGGTVDVYTYVYVKNRALNLFFIIRLTASGMRGKIPFCVFVLFLAYVTVSHSAWFALVENRFQCATSHI